jgi:hypothetical protein
VAFSRGERQALARDYGNIVKDEEDRVRKENEESIKEEDP